MRKAEKETFLKTFGANLAEIRRKQNVSQEELAYNADIDISTLSRIERGKSKCKRL